MNNYFPSISNVYGKIQIIKNKQMSIFLYMLGCSVLQYQHSMKTQISKTHAHPPLTVPIFILVGKINILYLILKIIISRHDD